MASFIFESAGILQETENTVLETENISVGSSSNVVTTTATINNPTTGSFAQEGEPPDNNNNNIPDHQEMAGTINGTTGTAAPAVTGRPGSGGATCFVAGTEITMADGSNKLIEDVQIGDELIGRDNVINKVIEFDHPLLGNRKLYGFNGQSAFVTEEHPFLTPAGWKAININATIKEQPALDGEMIGNLKVGDEILMHNGLKTVISSIEEYNDEPNRQLYNFKLDGNNTYVANEFIVHNKGDGTVICTALYNLGYLPEDIYRLDQKYGELAVIFDPALYKGYYAWGKPVAEYIQGNGIGNKLVLHLLARPVAGAWAKQMAHDLEPDNYNSNIVGKILMSIGYPICRAIGKALTTKVKEV